MVSEFDSFQKFLDLNEKRVEDEDAEGGVGGGEKTLKVSDVKKKKKFNS